MNVIFVENETREAILMTQSDPSLTSGDRMTGPNGKELVVVRKEFDCVSHSVYYYMTATK